MTATGRYSRVVECQSRRDGWNSMWVYRLECGVLGRRLRLAATGQKIHPAPLRVRCRCPKCMRGDA